MECQPIKPAFWICCGSGDVSPGKCFVVRGVAIGLEPGVDVCSLVVGKKFGGCWVIGDEEIRGD